MKTIGRFSPYLVILLAVAGVLGWARTEQRRAEEAQYEGIEVREPAWNDRLPAVRQETLQQPTEEAKLRTLTDRLTHHYRELDAPLRFKVIADRRRRACVALERGGGAAPLVHRTRCATGLR
jgi:hypothetical protein